MRLIFFEQSAHGKVILPDTEIRHLKVLRICYPLKIKGLCQGRLFLLELQQAGHAIVARILKELELPKKEKPSFLVPLIEWTRLEWCLEKLCELEAAHLYLYFSDHSADLKKIAAYPKKETRLLKIIKEAARQCGNAQLPLLYPPQKLTELLAKLLTKPPLQNKQITIPAIKLLALGSQATKTVEISDFQTHTGVIIGPEGDFSLDEYALLEKYSTVRRLGDVILRSETALIYSAAILRNLLGYENIFLAEGNIY